MNHQEAIEKVAKLMRLAKSSNEHEAALAAQRAQEIMTRFKIESISLNADDSKKADDNDNEPIMDFGRDPLFKGAHARTTWRVRLAGAIAEQNQVKIYLGHESICLVGRPSDCATVRYIFAWMQSELLRLSNEKTKGYSSSYGNAWRNGCVATIAERLRKANSEAFGAARQEANGALALVRVNNAIARIERRQQAVVSWMQANLNLNKGRARPGVRDHGGYEAGRRDGHSIRIAAPAGSLGAGRTQIGGAN